MLFHFPLALAALSLSPSFSTASPVIRNINDQTSRKAYILDNNPAGSAIISFTISPLTGKLSNPHRYPTGGIGEYGLTASATGTGTTTSGPDSLFSQGSVVAAGGVVFTVDAGSGGLSMFRITGGGQELQVVGRGSVSTLGDFPNSVAYNEALSTACVVNSGARSGVACFHVDDFRGLTPLDTSLRPIGITQTTPPVGPASTGSQISFTPSGSALILTVKGPTGGSGTIYAWPVVDGRVSHHGVANVLPTIKADFAFSFLDSNNTFLLTDAGGAAYIIDIASDLSMSIEKTVPLAANVGATCWRAYSEQFDSGYVISANSRNITVVDPSTGETKGVITLSTADIGGFDTAIGGSYMYVLTKGPLIAVIDLDGHGSQRQAVEIQELDTSSAGDRKGLMGMALYP